MWVLAADGWHGAHEARRRRTQSERFRVAEAQAAFIPGWLDPGAAELLFELAGEVPPGGAIVEIGSYLGRSTAFLAAGARDGVTVYAVDPHTGDRTQVDAGILVDTHSQFLENMARIGADNVTCIRARSLEAASQWDGTPIGLLFIDGWHSEDAVYQDGRAWAGFLAPRATVVFDDIDNAEVAAGIDRLVRAGTIQPIAGRVRKTGVCGPRSNWPRRVRDIAYCSSRPQLLLRFIHR